MKAAEVFPPGEYLAEELEAREWSQSDFAGIIGRPVQFVSELVSGKKELTAESAQQIAIALGTSAEMWLTMQNRYQLWKLNSADDAARETEQRAARAQVAQIIPLVALEKRKVIPKDTDMVQLRAQVMSDFGMATMDDSPHFSLAAKRANAAEDISLLQRGWVWTAAQLARAVTDAPTYSPEGLERLAEELPRLLREPDDFTELPARFLEVGVVLVFVEQLPGGKIDGVSFMMGATPVIALSGRGKRFDKVAFALLHETAHVVAGHVATGMTLDADDAHDADDPREKEANRRVQQWAFGGAAEMTGAINTASVVALAERHKVAPALVVGNLQHHGKLDWRTTLARGLPNVDDVLRGWVVAR